MNSIVSVKVFFFCIFFCSTVLLNKNSHVFYFGNLLLPYQEQCCFSFLLKRSSAGLNTHFSGVALYMRSARPRSAVFFRISLMVLTACSTSPLWIWRITSDVFSWNFGRLLSWVVGHCLSLPLQVSHAWRKRIWHLVWLPQQSCLSNPLPLWI